LLLNLTSVLDGVAVDEVVRGIVAEWRARH
jgi:hypothetical protein